MAFMSLNGIDVSYDKKKQILKGLNLEVEEGELVSLLGPSGCGKSTTLRVVAGFIDPQGGTFTLDGEDMTKVPVHKRQFGLVFQSYALFPHLSVYDNVAFGLRTRKMDKDVIDKKVREILEVCGLTELADRFPKQMSGGQRQRVAIGRAIVREPKVLLMDEPLSNLDAKLRVQMRTEISKLHKKLGTTFIYVTHDQTEAMTMGDRIVVMRDGIIQQIDTPQALYERPGNKFVAGFLGSPQMNFIDAVLKKADNYYVEFGAEATKTSKAVKYQVEVPAAKVTPELAKYVDKEVTLGIRPEALHDDEMFLSNASTGVVDATVEITEMMGAETYLYLVCAGVSLTARVDPRSTARPQDEIKIALDPNKIHLFDKETEETIIN